MKPGEKNYISQNGYNKLIKERNELTNVERPKVVELVSWAASLGDRSENADYQYGKRRLREIDARLRFLNQRLNSAEIVDYLSFPNNETVRFGATVTVEDETGETIQYIIVGQDEIDLEKGKISYRSPIGTSLLGKEVGDEVVVSTPSGKRKMEITSILYQRY